MDGCGPELNAMIDLINNGLDILDDEGELSEEDEDDVTVRQEFSEEYEPIEADDETELHAKMCANLSNYLPDGYSAMKHLSSGTSMKQAHD